MLTRNSHIVSDNGSRFFSYDSSTLPPALCEIRRLVCLLNIYMARSFAESQSDLSGAKRAKRSEDVNQYLELNATKLRQNISY